MVSGSGVVCASAETGSNVALGDNGVASFGYQGSWDIASAHNFGDDDFGATRGNSDCGYGLECLRRHRPWQPISMKRA